MKTWKQCAFIGFLAVIAFALLFIACDDGNNDSETPKKQASVIVDNTTPNGLVFTGKVTISSDDEYLADDWNATVAKVVAALNAGYNKDMGLGTTVNKTNFETVFASDKNAQVIVSSEAAYSIEVKSMESNILYLKSPIADDIDIQPAVANMWGGTDYHN